MSARSTVAGKGVINHPLFLIDAVTAPPQSGGNVQAERPAVVVRDGGTRRRSLKRTPPRAFAINTEAGYVLYVQ